MGKRYTKETDNEFFFLPGAFFTPFLPFFTFTEVDTITMLAGYYYI